MSSSPILAPLANLPGVSEIQGLGRFRENPENGLEAQVEVCLQTGISASGPPASSSIRWIGVGQMNLLVPGSRFNGGQAVRSAKMDRCHDKVSLAARRTPETLGNGSFSNSTAVPLTAKIGPAPGWLLSYTPSSGSALRGNPKFAFLPAMPPPAGRSIPATQRAHLVRSDKVPDTARKTAKSDTAGTEFSFAADIPISWTPGDVFLGRKDSGMLADPMDGETFLATDDPASGGDKATGALNFLDSQ
jgi:hypothetical protein